jgi:hypothetical protein
MTTLNQILLDSSAVLDLSASLPVGDELTLRSNYANQAVQDASAISQFPEFKKEYTLEITNNLLVTLPSGFREFHINPMGLGSSGGWTEYVEIKEEEKYGKSGNYCYVTGNPQSGYLAHFNNLLTGMSLSILYQAYPAGMQSLTSICELSDSTYVTRKIESYVLYSRGDARFPTAEGRANTVLLNMTGRKMKGAGGQGQVTKTGFVNPLG